MSTGQPPLARICPECGRRVPRRIERCRCGFAIGVEADLPVDSSAAAPRRAAPLWAAGAIVALGAAAFLLWPRGNPAEMATRAAAAEAVPAPEPPAVAEAVESEPEDEPLERPTNVPYLTRAVEPSSVQPLAAPRLPVAAPRSLESVIAAVLPAVVLVETPSGRGTGFLVAADVAITNAHVVESTAYVTLHFAAGDTVSARVASIASDHDLAILRLASAQTGLRPLTLGELARVRVGQEVLAIGSPHGLRNTVTRGIVSAVRRVGPVVLVQTDAAINPGNSGGPLVDATGRVVGIATMKVANGAESLGFAVAADHARALVETGSAAVGVGQHVQTAPSNVMPQPTDSAETVRASGVGEFERVMVQSARRADALDDYWKQFSKVCLARPARTSGDRPWFAIWERDFPTDAVAPACVRDFESFREAAATIRRGITEADEAARRAGVYPGLRRELLARYRLAWDGWEF
ncbi:MAG TPA: trypsin-like peptidase domain-containing protein [Vicinamibacterales bacterium]|nr:trypsin-like peptidase domain-containing protein [Vicinamibacterales bacterium]